MSSHPLSIAITGANSGIGLRAACQLSAAGHLVYALCRSPERGAAALDRINRVAKTPARLVVVDLADRVAISNAAQHLAAESARLDVLINNAAVFDQTLRTAQFTKDGHELFWATNHLGPFQLTAEISQLLATAEKPRVIFVASKGLITMPRIKIAFDRLDDAAAYTPTKAYYHAKLAQIMTAYTLAVRSHGELDVACIRVPAVRLDDERISSPLLRLLYAPKRRLAAPPERIAALYAQIALREERWTAATGPTVDEASRLRGIYLDENARPVAAPRFAYDPAARERLWRVSQEATGNPRWAWTE